MATIKVKCPYCGSEEEVLYGRSRTSKKDTQRMERDHLTLRTRVKRLCRKTICFSKSKEIHIAVVGTFINCFFWVELLMYQL